MKKTQSEESPTVYVIAGPNGAGKTTFAAEFLPGFVHCPEFVNADLIAAGLSPFAPESQAMKAGRLVLERIGELARQRATFGFETTLSGQAYVQRLSSMKEAGYRVALFFLWLPSADVAVARVASRVQLGGHDVPEADVRRRYATGLRNLFKMYRPMLDSFWIFDASRLPPKRIAAEDSGGLVIDRPDLYQKIELMAKE